MDVNEGRLSPEHVRERLVAHRAAFRWSQKQTAEEAGLYAGTIANIESGRNEHPRTVTLARLAQAFGVTLDEFLGDDPPKGPKAPRKAGAARSFISEARGGKKPPASLARTLLVGLHEQLTRGMTLREAERVLGVFRLTWEKGALDPAGAGSDMNEAIARGVLISLLEGMAEAIANAREEEEFQAQMREVLRQAEAAKLEAFDFEAAP